MNFKQASEIAKKNPGSILSRDGFGNFFIRLLDGKTVGEVPHALNATKTDSSDKLRIVHLEDELAALRNHIESEVEVLLKQRQTEINASWHFVESVKADLEHKKTELANELKKIELLTNAYADRFGKAEVRTIQETIDSREICSRCGGDGGAAGQCGKCDGSGWEFKKVETTHDIVSFTVEN
jgi:hypothetical protein